MADREIRTVLVGDATSLTKAMDKVGSGSKEMADDLDKASGEAKLFGKAMDGAAGAADSSEPAFMGSADLLDGLGGAFGLPTEGATNLMRSFGDLSGGFATLGPMVKGFGGTLSAVATGPMALWLLAGTAIVAGLVALWKNSETFRDIVSGAFEAVMGVVGPVVDKIGGAIGWLGDKLGFGADKAEEEGYRYEEMAADMQAAFDEAFAGMGSAMDSMVGPFERFSHKQELTLQEATDNLASNIGEYNNWLADIEVIFQKYGRAVAQYVVDQGPEFHGVADQLANAGQEMGDTFQWMIEDMQAAENQAKTLATTMSGLSMFENIAGGLAGFNLMGARIIPKRHTGGIVPGPLGSEQPILAQAGERVSPLGQRNGPQVIQLVLDGQVITEVVHDGLLAEQRRGGNLGFVSA